MYIRFSLVKTNEVTKFLSLRLTVLLAFSYHVSIAQSSSIQTRAVNKQNSFFIHPGMLHSKADLDRIRNNVRDSIEPWKSSWRILKQNKWLAKEYQPKPLDTVGRGVGSVGQSNISNDCAAAYYLALAWYITGDEQYAKKTVDILNGWSYKVRLINGKDAVLCAGIYGYKFANAAEIIRYTYKGWSERDIEQCKLMLKNVFYPVIKDFSPFANGNWDAACIPTMMSVGIFCEDKSMFDRAVKYYEDGYGDGSLPHYIINESGQVQESGRDQPHTQGGIGHLANAAEIGYKQGVDMYGLMNNRLLKGFEYTSKYNLGNEVPFEPYVDRTGKYIHKTISDGGRGRWSEIYEMVYNHYVNRVGVEAPFTSQVAAKIRPEGSAVDHPGMGTLLFTLPPLEGSAKLLMAIPVAPSGVIAKGSSSGISLSWIESLGATGYTIKRSSIKGEPYSTIAKNIKAPMFKDMKVIAGKLYHYVVLAEKNLLLSKNSLQTSISAGLPNSWTGKDIGSVKLPGYTNYDGDIFTMEAAGTDIKDKEDQFHYTYQHINGDVTITARFVPQVASQVAKFGIMIRETLASNSKHAALLFMPAATKDIEVPDWNAGFIIRPSTGAETSVAALSNKLGPPFVTWGRFLEPYWLRLSRSGNIINASVSPDGTAWTSIGRETIALNKKALIGLAGCSRLTTVSTTIQFDNVSIQHSVTNSKVQKLTTKSK